SRTLPHRSTLFPYTTLFRSGISLDSLLNSWAYRAARARGIKRVKEALEGEIKKPPVSREAQILSELLSYPFARMLVACVDDQHSDRKSTRLNSSHVKISYAV